LSTNEDVISSVARPRIHHTSAMHSKAVPAKAD